MATDASDNEIVERLDDHCTRDKLDASRILTNAEEREVAWRCVFIGQTQAEVGDVFDVSSGTIHNVMEEYRALNSSSGGDLEMSIIDEFDGVVEPYK
jgi:DNA-directed RNA polymerase specialized sigma24 family protein